jgi:hypothetical protein
VRNILIADDMGESVPLTLCRRQDEGGTRDQHRRNLRDCRIETQGCKLQNARCLGDCEPLDLGGCKVRNAGMRNADGFWRTGRA